MTFTAMQFARALGLTKRTVLQQLSGVAAAAVQPSAGGQAKAWPIEALPAPWRQQLAAAAGQRGCRDALQYLEAISSPWMPMSQAGKAVPLAEIGKEWISRAFQLREAMALPLDRQHDIAEEALVELGLSEFERVTRNLKTAGLRGTMGARQWQRLFRRTLERDAGAENWERLEIYLDEPAFVRRAPAPSREKARFNHEALREFIQAEGNIQNKADPTEEERAYVFHEAFKHLETLLESLAAPAARAAAKASLVDFLWNALPSLSSSPDALRRMFDRKMSDWITGGRFMDAIEDSRRLASGNFRRPDFKEDLRKISRTAVSFDGNESLAYRKLREEGQLSQAFLEHYPSFDSRADKSAVPNSIRRSITGAVEATVPRRRGPKAVRDSGPWIARDWSGVRPGDWFNLDDVTWNHYFKVRLPGGLSDITRGECLAGADALTDYPLAFLLIAGHYNGQHVRQLIARAHDMVGLPRKGIILERGVWKSRFVKGEESGWESLHWRDFQGGIEDPRLGLKIRHATSPRAKPIEGWFHHLQDRMRCIPGFVGFNERTEKVEAMQKLIARARRGDEEALAQFPSQEEWRDKITAVIEEFMHEPGNGDRLRGRTPAEAWKESILASPLRQLHADARHLLATHQKIVRLHPTRGIVIKLPGRQMPVCYANEETEKLIFRGETWARILIDIDRPDVLTCVDMKGKTRFSVAALQAHATEASKEHMKEMSNQRRGGRQLAKTLYGEVKQEVRSNITIDSEHSEADKEEGRFHNAAVEQVKAQEKAHEKKVRKIHREAAAIGASIGAEIKNPDCVLDGIEWEKDWRARAARSESGTP